MLLKEIIAWQISSILLEIRGSFKWSEFKSLSSLERQFDYAVNNLQELGRGTSRAAFLLSNRYVLKIALPSAPRKGIGQNNGELKIFLNETNNVVAKIYDYDEKGHWLVSEIAKPILREEEFKRLTGFQWDRFRFAVSLYKDLPEELDEIERGLKMWNRRLPLIKQQNDKPGIKRIQNNINSLQQRKAWLEKIINSSLFKGTISLIKKNNVVLGDIIYLDHWGKTADGRVILIDYGFTQDLVHLYQNVAV